MATGRIRRGALRGATALVLGWLAVLGGVVAFAPSASADPAVTVEIRDLTPPLVSVDAKGTVTFVNDIADKTVQVGGGGLLPSVVTAVVHTDVTLGIPDVNHPIPLQPGQKVSREFVQSCLTCTITYTYRATVPSSSIVGSALNTVTSKAVAMLPQSQVVTYNGQQTTVQIGAPTPFLVNTLLPLPNLPSVNLPKLPALTVPAPAVPAPLPPSGGGVTVPGGTTPLTTTTTTTTTTPGQGINGSPYAYDTGNGAPQMSPVGNAAPAFVPDGSSAGGSGSTAGSAAGSAAGYPAGGAGGTAGSYDGASVPVFGQLAGLDGKNLDAASANSPSRNSGTGTDHPLPVSALVAVVTLAGVLLGLVRTVRSRPGSRR